MTPVNPPYALQSGSHSAQLFRQAISTMLNPAGGVVAPGGLAISQHGGGNMSVDIAGGVPNGQAWVAGTTSALVQGLYYCYNDATYNLPINAADPTNPRVDTIIAQVEDAAYAGANNDWKLAVVAGTPTAGATLTNLNGAGAVPASSLILGYVLVPAAATSILTANISYVATPVTLGLSGLGGQVIIPGSETLTSTSFATMPTPDQVTNVIVGAGQVIEVLYQATWQESVSSSAQAAIFLNGIQVQLAQVAAGAASLIPQVAYTNAGVANKNWPLFSATGLGLATAIAGGGAPTQYPGDATTGQIMGALATGVGSPPPGLSGGIQLTEVGGAIVFVSLGGPIQLFAAAGTYTVSVRFKSSSGSVSVSNRRLYVRVK